MSAVVAEDAPVPNWLLKLEERREKRLKSKLGHEAGAGAKCQKCEDKCPGLDLHFWRKICKVCKCAKEDHDIIDDDIYGYVQFQLLGSKPVKSKGVFLKDQKDEVILEWTPKGSSNDVKKYLDELPADMIAVKGSEGAKIRKQRLQKQMPAHDIDASLCHQLTEDEIKEMEEYVSHIRKNCVGQGKIIRLSLFKANQHLLNPSQPQFLSQIPPNQVASSQTVYLHSSDISNNLHNLNLRDKASDASLKALTPQNYHPVVDNQTPANVGITDLNYQANVVHPLTTTNVERHQEQFEIQNANFERVLQPHLNYAPNYLAPREQHQLPVQVGQPTNLKYPVEDAKGHLNKQRYNLDSVNNPLMQYNPNFVDPVDQIQIPTQVGQPKDLKYPSNLGTDLENLNLPPINNATHPLMQNQDNLNYPTLNSTKGHLKQYNPNFVSQNENIVLPQQVGQLTDLKYPIGGPNLDQVSPLNANMVNQYPNQQLGQTGQLIGGPNLDQVNQYPNQQLGANTVGPLVNPLNANMVQYPNQLGATTVGPLDQTVTASKMGQIRDLKYPTNTLQHLNNQLGPVNPNNTNKKLDHTVVPTKMGQIKDITYPNQTLGEANSIINANPTQYGSQLDPNQSQLGYNTYPNQMGQAEPLLGYTPENLRQKPGIPILEAQNAINPFENHQNLQSVGYIRDIDYPTEIGAQHVGPDDRSNQNIGPDDRSNQNVVQNVVKCHSCQDNFEDGAVAITADRTSNLWHSKCFNCHTCKQPLADLLYFYHKETDNIYCGRDYAILKGIPRCLACDELIFVREYCLAEENTFHIKHFCCFECDSPLAGQQYILENNQPVCMSCYDNLKAEKCNDCQNKIKPNEQGVILQNLHWHATPECFACKKCRKSLLSRKMLLRNQNVFCSDVCFKSF